MSTLSNRALMVAFHLPPAHGSGGVERVAGFCRHLPRFGWEPLVVTPVARVHPVRDDSPERALPDSMIIRRGFALDSSRDLALRGHYPRLLALPDRWVSWWLSAVPAGLELIRQFNPQVIWSSYPPATAHLVAYTLHLRTGLPWIADLRDPMLLRFYPESPSERWVFRWLERQTVSRAARVTVTTPSMIRYYRRRFPGLPSDHWRLIPNGVDPGQLARIGGNVLHDHGARDRVVTWVHSGHLYPGEGQRDPQPFLQALAAARGAGELPECGVRVVLRASGAEGYFAELIGRLGLAGVVELAPSLPHAAALAEIAAAAGLLLFQGRRFNHQIPAKLYEYLATGRPILGLTSPHGDSGKLLGSAGCSTIVPLEDAAAIARVLPEFLRQSRGPTVVSGEVGERYSRVVQAGELARVMSEVGVRR